MEIFKPAECELKGVNVIEASAGTGKTFSIQKIFLRLVVEMQLPVEKILAVTFTEAATAELRDKIRSELAAALQYLESRDPQKVDPEGKIILDKVLGGKASAERATTLLKIAIFDFDTASIFTIHGFCSRMLNECSFESAIPFDTELINDQQELISAAIDDFWRRRFYGREPELAAAAEHCGVTLTALRELAKSMTKPGIELARKDAKPVGDAEMELLAACNNVRKEWDARRNEIYGLIVSNGDLKAAQGKTFGKANMDAYSAVLDDFRRGIMNAESFETILKFTNGFIAASMKEKPKNPVSRHGFFDICDRLQDALDGYSLSLKTEFHRFLLQELERRKLADNVQSFDDLLVRLRDAVRSNDLLRCAIRDRYGAVLIDEFQDTDPVQYEIFRTVFIDMPPEDGRPAPIVFFIGDPKQAIYSFRSADVFTYFKATRRVERQFVLGVNYRTQTGLVEGINAFFGTASKDGFNPFVLDEMAYRPVAHTDKSKGNRRRLVIDGKDASALRLCWTDGDGETVKLRDSKKAICRSLSAEIMRLLNLSKEGRAGFETPGEKPQQILPSDFAVLTRSNWEAAMVKAALEKRRIPAVLQNTGTVFDTEEAWHMEIFLRAVADPGDYGRVAAALGTRLFAEDPSCIADNGADAGSRKRFEDWTKRFQRYHHVWKTRAFIRMFREFMNEKDAFHDKRNIRSRLLSFTDGERALTNLMHLAELLNDAEASRKLGMRRLLAWLREKRASPDPSNEDDAALIRLERDEQAVKIMTVHKSKGLEFPIVYCPFAPHNVIKSENCDFIYHDGNFKRLLHLGEDKDGAKFMQTKTEEFAELMRLLYVAATRAKNRNTFYWGNISNSDFSPLGYLFCEPRKEKKPEDGKYPRSMDADSYFDAMKYSRFREVPGEALEAIKANPKFDAFKADYPEEVPSMSYSFVPDDNRLAPSARIFKGRIDTGWKVSSFSALTGPAETDMSFDEFDDDSDDMGEAAAPDEKKDSGFWSQAKGRLHATELGNCVHSIFENIDFAADPEAMKPAIAGVLRNYFKEPEKLLDSAAAMVLSVLGEQLQGATSFRLSDIRTEHRASELEFYYPLEQFSRTRLSKAFAEYAGSKEIRDRFPAALASCDFDAIRGFMNGKMDLVFRHGGRYYILDWKTNYVASQASDYTPERIARKMISSLYILQYHIYVAALDRLLKKQSPADYDYEKDFGGVFYLFLRGMGARTKAGCQAGVFFDRPDKKLIEVF